MSSQLSYTAGHGFVSQEPQVHLAHAVVQGGEEKQQCRQEYAA